jgi:peptidoglycan/xylan/chitin deacetylase (PgdA/CDA1 family)
MQGIRSAAAHIRLAASDRNIPVEEIRFTPKIKLAVTVDDLFRWKGIPWSPGYSPSTVVPAMMAAFARHDLEHVYGFSATAPAGGDRAMREMFDQWSEAGHRIGNHTHYHANLNWVDEGSYIRDIERTAELIEPWIACAPVRYFRYAMDNWGNTAAKYNGVQDYLRVNGYTSAPISVWFYDTEFLLAHVRVSKANAPDAMDWLRQQFINTALKQLQLQATTARALFGRDPVFIWLIHATPLAADCLDDILAKFQSAGVEFSSLEEAMADPLNQQPAPLITPRFLNHIQKWAVHKGLSLEECPPSILEDVEELHPMDGMGYGEVMVRVFKAVAEEMGGQFERKLY